MGVKIRTVKNDIPKMQKTYAALNGKKIQVGVFGEQAYIAGVHEYGCNITAKNSRYLTIPCSKKSFGKRARDFNDLFFIEGKSGEKFLAREVGKEKSNAFFGSLNPYISPSVLFCVRGTMKILTKLSRSVNDCRKV